MSRDDAPAHAVITSSTNPNLKLMRSLGRRKVRLAERAFLVEGRRLVEEAVRHGAAIRMLLVREDVPEAWPRTLAIDPKTVRRVAAEAFDASSDVEHAQGVAAICDMPHVQSGVEHIAGTSEIVLVLDRLRDPGNLGTALRSAAAAGIDIVLTTSGTVDPMAPKSVRAGMGAHFRLQIGEVSPATIDGLRRTGKDIVYADASANTAYSAYWWNEACALVIGGETEELSPELEALVTRRVRIPMRGEMESLNAGVAASVMLFEALRQRSVDGEIM